MADLALYLGVTIIGYFFGSKLRSKRDSLLWTGKVQTVAITLLVLCMGARMGANKEITENLSTIGISAFLITVVIMLFSTAAIYIVRKLLGIDRYGRVSQGEKTDNRQVFNNPAQMKNTDTADLKEQVHAIEKEEEKQNVNMMTIVILISVIIGMLTGYFVIRDIFAGRMEEFDSAAGIGIKVGLCLLLVFVGLDLGLDGTVVSNFKRVGFRILAVPAATIIGTLIGAAAAMPFIGMSLRECLAVGSGFGWYTLAPGIIMEAGYLTASAVSFLHNVMRELLAIVFIPLVAKKIGYLETTAMPGAAAMDVCLPIVEKATRSEIAVYSFVSGVILSILVPVLVPIIIG